MKSAGRSLRPLRVAWSAAAFGSCVAAFYDARALNAGFALPSGDTVAVPPSELVFYAWYALYGSLAVVFLAICLTELRWPELASAVWARAIARADACVYGLSLACFASSLAFRRFVLLGQPIADDESTYVFIARTLLSGRLTNPLPEDPEFFANQFVVMNAHGWHGKYPIGHPLVLALGEALGASDLVGPALGAACVVLVHRLGRRLFDERVALIGAGLLLASPHFVWTCATLLSQPTSCALLLLGMLALLRSWEDPRGLGLASLAGALFGFGVLVRPLPGVLFAAGVPLCFGVEAVRSGRGLGALVPRSAAFAAGLVPFLAAMLAINHAQSGGMFQTGYHDFHGSIGLMQNVSGEITNSLGGALIRENFWLLGWTFALLLVPLCRPAHAPSLFWAMLAAELAYRVLAPKTVVSSTGPIYLTEIVPLLVLAVADVSVRLGRVFEAARVRPSAVALAASITGACMFVPLQASALYAGARTRQVVYDRLAASGADTALVFTNTLAAGGPATTWAYYPDNPSPQLDDRWLFARVPATVDSRARMLEFWRRRFPDRRAFAFVVNREGDTRFDELQAP